MYKVFICNWWKRNPSYPNGLEPDPTSRKTTIKKNIKTEKEARELAQSWNRNHEPGPLSRKAEYTET